ncbi:MAG: hypothetical protein E7I57_04510 [Anaerococcus vaginalis]|uniref:hypothetical protein n=1 Tax=Anaerococcus vaginalis TaxID=33037 RepID=UPI00288BCCC2|nr:hypothetical protein [Anaerococcus vaginalis]MDU4378677.1 hypothetical protein [Anaerococcus vaginalis]MDU5824814.1 hypothetical protein [Anaerococcus vaginalis]
MSKFTVLGQELWKLADDITATSIKLKFLRDSLCNSASTLNYKISDTYSGNETLQYIDQSIGSLENTIRALDLAATSAVNYAYILESM